VENYEKLDGRKLYVRTIQGDDAFVHVLKVRDRKVYACVNGKPEKEPLRQGLCDSLMKQLDNAPQNRLYVKPPESPREEG